MVAKVINLASGYLALMAALCPADVQISKTYQWVVDEPVGSYHVVDMVNKAGKVTGQCLYVTKKKDQQA